MWRRKVSFNHGSVTGVYCIPAQRSVGCCYVTVAMHALNKSLKYAFLNSAVYHVTLCADST